jgi:MFS family permease
MRNWRVFLIGLGTAIVALDTAVNIAFPAITHAFDAPLQSIQWIIVAYVLTYASFMLAAGHVGDLIDYRLVFRLGLAWSAAALVLCAAAPSYPILLVARVAQGIGAASALACGPALLTSLYSEGERARALGLYTLMFSIGGAMGPIVGGLLMEAWGWPAVFWFRAPIALAVALLLPELPRLRTGRAERRSLDLSGAILLAAGLIGLLLALDRLRYVVDHDFSVLLLGGVATAALAAFIRHERGASEPLIDLAMFRSSSFSIANVGSVLVNLASFTILLLVPFYLARMTELPDAVRGVVLALSGIGTAVGSPVGAMLVRRAGTQPTATTGAALCAMGLALIATAGAHPGLHWLLAGLALQGVGLGLFQVAYMDLVIGSIALNRRGVAGSLALLTRTLGVVAGATSMTLVYGTVESIERAAGGDGTAAFLAGFRSTFWLAAALPAVLVGIAIFRSLSPSKRG